jgi:hypothetical protein
VITFSRRCCTSLATRSAQIAVLASLTMHGRHSIKLYSYASSVPVKHRAVRVFERKLIVHVVGVHRSLGVDISQVRSVCLDEWTDEQIDGMRRGGNARANAALEVALCLRTGVLSHDIDRRRLSTNQQPHQYARRRRHGSRANTPQWQVFVCFERHTSNAQQTTASTLCEPQWVDATTPRLRSISNVRTQHLYDSVVSPRTLTSHLQVKRVRALRA